MIELYAKNGIVSPEQISQLKIDNNRLYDINGTNDANTEHCPLHLRSGSKIIDLIDFCAKEIKNGKIVVRVCN